MSNNNNSGGTSFTTLLQILFIALKLTGFIDWNWWIVLSPIWIQIVIGIGLALWGWK